MRATAVRRDLQQSQILKRGKETRAKILDTAVAYFVSGVPWRQASVLDIAVESGYSPGTVYQYFRDLEDVFRAVLEEMAAHGMKPTPHMRAVALLLRMEG